MVDTNGNFLSYSSEKSFHSLIYIHILKRTLKGEVGRMRLSLTTLHP